MSVRLPRLRLLFALKSALIRNRLDQLVNQSPLRVVLVLLFVAAIWAALYVIFDNAFSFMRRFEQSAIAIPYVFNIFFVAMTFLLAFSTAVLVYGALFSRPEPSFLLTTPHSSRNVVVLMYLESLFFSSWSLLLLGVPLMLAIGQALGLPWFFYIAFVVAFLGFIPIPGSLGLLVALGVALWLPRFAKRTLFYAAGVVVLVGAVWWGRLWAASSAASAEWVQGVLAEFEYLKGALLPSTWVANAIQKALEGNTTDAAFYLGVTISTSLFFSWIAVNVAARKLLVAFGRANAAPNRRRARSSWASRWLTRVAFFYLPVKMRTLILKDVRNFLRDPLQWSQLAILFGLMGLYLLYLPRARPEGFNIQWQAVICFLNYGTITLILSTFTSRFVFPMISLEGRQMWLAGLWPMSRRSVVWAKLFFAVTITAFAALTVTGLAIFSLQLPFMLGAAQVVGTLATCIALCSLAVGLGARLPNYRESDSGRIASGLGGTVNLIASVGLVSVSVGLFGGICYRLAGNGRLDEMDLVVGALLAGIVALGAAITVLCLKVGLTAFTRQEF